MARQIIQYSDYRQQINNADVLLYRGTDFTSRMIRTLTKSAYSHAGLAVWWNDRLMVLEAVGNGVVAMPLSINLAKHHGGIDLFQSKTLIADSDRLDMVRFAQEQLGKAYAFFQLAIFGGRLLCGARMSSQEPRANGAYGEYFCSEYVSHTYLKANIDLVVACGAHFTSPDDLACSPALQCVGTLRQ